MSEATFYTAVKERWNPGDDNQLRKVTHAVLHHLIHAVPDREAYHVLSNLSVDITMLATQDDTTISEGRKLHTSGEERDADFFDLVAEEAGVSFDTARQASIAVFHALKTHIPPEEIKHLRDMLSGRLERAWENA